MGGTALGGGTLLGLGSALTGATAFEDLCALARRGHRSHIDLMIADIYGEGEIGLPADATASAFAKFAGDGSVAPLDLPDQEGTAEQPDAALTINVRESGEIVVSGKVVNVPVLVSMVADEVARKGGDPARVNIVVRGDARGNSRAMNDITTALGKINVTRINLAVEVPR